MELTGRIPNFDEPIEALYICHENILKRMRQMEDLSDALLRGGASEFMQQKEYWRELLSFIRHTVANHTRDEEEGLFPMLARKADHELAHLLSDHRWANATEEWLHQQFEVFTSYEHLPSQVHLQQFASRAKELADFYTRHITFENEQLFPLAKNLLTEEQVSHLGAVMRRHRKIELHPPMADHV
jgi:hemerythrin-like domain-containing protein